MNTSEPNSAEKRRKDNIERNREFQLQLGLNANESVSSFAVDQVVRHNCLTRKVAELASRRSKRLEKQDKEERKQEEMSKKFVCEHCLKHYRIQRYFLNKGALILHQRKMKCELDYTQNLNKDIKDSITIQVDRHLLGNEEVVDSGANADEENEANLDVFTKHFLNKISTLSSNDLSLFHSDDDEKENNSISDQSTDCRSDEDQDESYKPEFVMGTRSDNTIIDQYMKFQETLFDATYGIDCLGALSFEDMVNMVRAKYQYKFKPKLLDNIPIYLFWMENQLSRQAQQDYLDLLHKSIFSLRGRTSSIPLSVGGVKNMINSNLNLYNYATLNILWPTGWNLKDYDGVKTIETISLYFRDPLELISELLVKPEIMFKFKEHVQFTYFKDCRSPYQSDSYSNLMNSRWCRLTEVLVKNKHPDGHILPLIFYLDGVHLNSQIQNKVTPVMCTTGNFSDELINKDVSKCVIGYLPTLVDVKADLEQHLLNIFGSKSRLSKEWQRFELLVEREFWKEINRGLNKHWETGIRLYVLGQGIKLFYPCIAFFVSDDPQQHRNAGIEEGNCIHGCIQCTYSYKDGVYDERIHRPRDIIDLKNRCCKAENAIFDRSQNKRISKEDDQNLQYLKSQNVHPFLNPMFFAPLGAENNIYTATPPDTLHLFCAGLMKSLVRTIITIIYTISKLDKPNYGRAGTILDHRIINFEYVNEEMPHVHWTRFNEGIMCHVPSNTAERGRATGSFGGYRSTSFISLLIQLFYSIGNDRKILPDDFIINNVEVNIQERVLRAIRTLLEVYFDVCRSVWENRIPIILFERKVKHLYAHYMLVWDINQSLLSSEKEHNIVCKQRNPHKIVHLSSIISMFGSLRKCDSSTWERFHQKATTSIWRGSSKRRRTLCLEMLKKYHLINLSSTLHVISKIHSDLNEISNEMKPDEHIDYVLYLPLTGNRKIRFRLNCERQTLSLDDDWSTSICRYEPIDNPSKFIKLLFNELNFVETIQNICGINWTDRSTMVDYETYFIGAIKFISDKKSIGEGRLFASPKGAQKYDYALVKVSITSEEDLDDDRVSLSDGRPRRCKRSRQCDSNEDTIIDESQNNTDNNLTTTTILVKLLLFFGMNKFENKQGTAVVSERQSQSDTNIDQQLFCIVQELDRLDQSFTGNDKLKKQKTNVSLRHERDNEEIILGKQFKWATHSNHRNKFVFHIIPVESILRPVFVVPEVNDSYDRNKPKPSDLFYMLDRVFFDRSGWTGDCDVNMEEFEAKTADEERNFLHHRSLGNLILRRNTKNNLCCSNNRTDDGNYAEEEEHQREDNMNIYFDYDD